MINYADLNSAFQLMGQGMLGIFVVMGVIILAVYGLGALNAKRRKKSKKEQ